MKALILAAGYATRLYPLTKDYPKPLLKVGDRPIIDYILDKLAGISDIEEIIVVTNSKFIGRFKKWKQGLSIDKRLTLVDDLTRTHQDKLGAIGDMDFAISNKRINDDLLVIGGDNLFDESLDDLLSFTKKNKSSPVIGVYDIKNKHKASHYGVIKLGTDKKILDFSEKPKRPKSTYVAMCLYYFPKATLCLLKEYLSGSARKNDATGFYIHWLSGKVTVYGFVFERRWYDIGDHNFYNQAKANFAT